MARRCERMCAACSVCEKAEQTEVENLTGFRLGVSGHLLNHVTWISVVIIVAQKKGIKM